MERSRREVSEHVTVNMKHEVKLLPVTESVQKKTPLNEKERKKINKSGIGELNVFYFSNVQITGKEVPHNPSWPLPLQAYVVVHFLLVLRVYHDLFENKMVSTEIRKEGGPRLHS